MMVRIGDLYDASQIELRRGIIRGIKSYTTKALEKKPTRI